MCQSVCFLLNLQLPEVTIGLILQYVCVCLLVLIGRQKSVHMFALWRKLNVNVTKTRVSVQGCVGTHRWTFADEAMWGVTGYSTGPSVATRFSLASIKHCVTALTYRGVRHKKCYSCYVIITSTFPL